LLILVRCSKVESSLGNALVAAAIGDGLLVSLKLEVDFVVVEWALGEGVLLHVVGATRRVRRAEDVATT
jgi:hypothetical protein